MKNDLHRIPKNYDGLDFTGREIGGMADVVLSRITQTFESKAQNIFNTFLGLLNDRIRPFVKPVSFTKGKLVVKVKNATLLSILSSQEKAHLLHNLRVKLPSVVIQDIFFQIG
ncbi:MAG: DUF721 domain-containing protein [Simkaniaceae bacterium]|nr:DUF721 domain-containing protein [Simkaniaceae bacterium]